MTEKPVSEALKYRRSVRKFDTSKHIDPEAIKKFIQLATLAPNSSNLQLWEFYHIVSPGMKEKMIPLCLNQNAAKTADQFVVVVTRKDLWKKRAKANLEFIKQQYHVVDEGKVEDKRIKLALDYYKKIIPFVYGEFLGIWGWIKYVMVRIAGIFKPVYREVRAGDIRVVAHKSVALAAQSFMLEMSANGYDTCPMEGIDSRRIKRLLGLPRGAEINMVIACGIRTPEGIYGERFRIPFEEVYFRK